MRKLYLLLLLLLPVLSLRGFDLYKGYIITLNGYHLTGQIGEIYLAEDQRQVVFVNDFSTPYMISPQLIAGFAYADGEELVTYQSMFLNKNWAFLEVVKQGEGLKLLRAPEESIEVFIDQFGLNSQKVKSNDVYIQLRKRKPERIKRIGFRKQVTQLLGRRAPNLAKKIGSKGYRYNDLDKICEEYLEEYKTTRYIL
ncbi:MAG: hypothetical protein AAF242_05530 [Bacteroidota bacterium]